MKVSMFHEDFHSLLNYAAALDDLYPWLRQTDYIYNIARIEDAMVTLDDSLAVRLGQNPQDTYH